MLNIPKTIFVMALSFSLLTFLISISMMFGMNSSPLPSPIVFVGQNTPYPQIFVCGFVNGFLAYKIAKKKSAFIIYTIMFWVAFAAPLLILQAISNRLYPPSTLNSITIIR